MDAKLLPPAVAAKFPAILAAVQLDVVCSAGCRHVALAVLQHQHAAHQHQFAASQHQFAAHQHLYAAILAVTPAASQLDADCLAECKHDVPFVKLAARQRLHAAVP